MYGDITAKFQATLLALGCTSRKELCARFVAVNPATQCNVDRLNKWMQGRAQPRSPHVFNDWAKVLGTGRSGGWVANSGLDEFLQELSGQTGVAIDTLRQTDKSRPPAGAQRTGTGLVGGLRALCGTFAWYAESWSPHYPGRFLRGSLVVRPVHGGTVEAVYSEMLLDGQVHMPGAVTLVGRVVHIHAHEPGGGSSIFLTLIMPGPPASVMCGIMAGASFLSHEPLPSASRVVFVRVPDGTPLEASNRIISPGPLAFAADLRSLGMTPTDGARLDRLINELLGGGVMQISTGDQAVLAAILDSPFLSDPPPRRRLSIVPGTGGTGRA